MIVLSVMVLVLWLCLWLCCTHGVEDAIDVGLDVVEYASSGGGRGEILETLGWRNGRGLDELFLRLSRLCGWCSC